MSAPTALFLIAAWVLASAIVGLLVSRLWAVDPNQEDDRCASPEKR